MKKLAISLGVLLALSAAIADAQPRGRLLGNGGMIVEDEGAPLMPFNKINFIGPAATCVSNLATLTIDCTFTGVGGGGIADPGSNGIMKRTALNVTAPAVAGTDYLLPSGNAATATALAANGTNCAAGSYPLGVDAQGNAEGCTVAGGGGGSGNMIVSSGAGAPSANCTAGITRYLDTANQDDWFCSSLNTWKKNVSTTNTGQFIATGQTGTAPTTPASGNVSEYFDSTALVPQAVDATGAKSTMVRPLTAVANQYVTSIGANGVGVLAALNSPGATVKGGVQSKTCNSGDFINAINTDGTETCGTPAGGGGGSAAFTYATGYGEITVTGADTTLCSVTIPGGTLKAGGSVGATAASMRFNIKNNSGNGDLTVKVWYGSQGFDIFGVAVGGSAPMAANFMLANDLSSTTAQTIVAINGTSGISMLPFEPAQTSSGDLVYKLTAHTTASSDVVRVWHCSFVP